MPCGGRDGARGFRAAAADRRRDDEPRAHRGEDPSELPARADGVRHRREPRGRRGVAADVEAGAAAPYRQRRARGVRQDRGRACARRGEQAAALARRRAQECAAARLVELPCRRGRASLGTRVFEDYPVAELIDYIDWSPFFSTWELTGKFPAILDDEKFGEAARSLYDDAPRC